MEFNCRMTIEQRINIKFCVKLRKTAAESLKMLCDVYGDSSMSRTRVFEWHKRFVEGRKDVEDDPKSGRPCTSTTDTNIKKVWQLVRSDRRLTIRVIANEVGMDKETVRTILVDTLGMRKECAKMVPRLLTLEESSTIECMPRHLSADGSRRKALGKRHHRRRVMGLSI